MEKTPATIVIVPCFNEAARLNIEAFVAAGRSRPHVQFLFVDDGSTDATSDVLSRLTAQNPHAVPHVALARNQGKAEAVRLGMLRAFDLDPAFVGFLDADLATPLAELDAMSSAFDDPEVLVAMGSRVSMLGRDIRRSAWRHYTGRVFATVASLALGLRVYDTQCGAKLFRNVPAVRQVFAKSFASSWAFDVEILARLLQHERAAGIPPVTQVVVEVPLKSWTDIAGSKIGVVESLVAGSQLFLLWWRYRRGKAPPKTVAMSGEQVRTSKERAASP